MKKIKFGTKILAVVMALSALVGAFASCSAPSADEINATVDLPDTYHIEYEVTGDDGVIRTVSKTVDESGNIRFVSGETETVFIKDGISYVEYQKNKDGEVSRTEGKKVTADYVKTATAEFDGYAEQSKNKYLPTAKEVGETEIAGRKCTEYQVSVGIKAFGVTYSYYVDNETGVCLGYDTAMILAGIETDNTDTVFTCTAFETEGVELIVIE